MVWLKYLDILNVHSLPIIFRNKDNGWNGYNVEYGDHYKMKHDKDPYMNLFLSSIISRKCCYACPSKGIERCSDLTIGDFWWIDSIDSSMFDDKGTSIVLVHTKKGEKLINNVSDFLILKDESIENAVKYKASLVRSTQEPESRSLFFKLLLNTESPDFNALYKKLCVYYNKTIAKKCIIFVKRIVKRMLNS